MIKLLEKDNETYYNTEYVELMINRAFQHGFYNGVKVELHFFISEEEDLKKEAIDNIKNEVNKKLFSTIEENKDYCNHVKEKQMSLNLFI